MAENWLEKNYIDRVSLDTGAGTTDVDSSRLDMQTISGEEVTFILQLGAVTDTSALEIQVWEHTADAASGTQITSSDCTFTAATSSDTMMACTVKRSKITKRWVWCRIKRGTANAAIDSVLAVVSGLRTKVTAQPTEVIKSATVAA